MAVRDMRQVARPWAKRAVSALDQFNQRHPWSHNDHFHGWILRNLPRERGSALEVGCGHGDLALALSKHFLSVRAIDRDAVMVRHATARLQGVEHAKVEQSSFLNESGHHDLITMVAVLHHLEHEAALEHARTLLKPGGRLLVVGLSHMESTRDFAWDTASVVLNPITGVLKHPRAASPSTQAPYPRADPELSFGALQSSVGLLLPGAHFRRRLFFRHTFVWEKAHA